MTAVRVQGSAALRIDEIHRYSRDRWGRTQADSYITGLFDAFERIAAGGVASRPVPPSSAWMAVSFATRSTSYIGSG